MKHFTLKFFFSMVMVLLGFSNSFATSGTNLQVQVGIRFTYL